MRITVFICCYNSEAYIKQVLDSIYDFADKIVILNGSYNPKIRPEISLDSTAEIIFNYPDKKKKIYHEVMWSQDEVTHRNRIFFHVIPLIADWLFIVDDDEVYHKDDLVKLRKFLEEDRPIEGYFIHSLDFVNSFDWYRKNYHRRLFRVQESMKFYGINRVQYGKRKYIVRHFAPIVKYHYSHVCGPEKAKIKLAEINHKSPWRYANGKFMRDDLRVNPFKGEHPAVMKNHPYRSWKWQPPENCLS